MGPQAGRASQATQLLALQGRTRQDESLCTVDKLAPSPSTLEQSLHSRGLSWTSQVFALGRMLCLGRLCLAPLAESLS